VVAAVCAAFFNRLCLRGPPPRRAAVVAAMSVPAPGPAAAVAGTTVILGVVSAVGVIGVVGVGAAPRRRA
jgi:hypothetical protein